MKNVVRMAELHITISIHSLQLSHSWSHYCIFYWSARLVMDGKHASSTVNETPYSKRPDCRTTADRSQFRRSKALWSCSLVSVE